MSANSKNVKSDAPVAKEPENVLPESPRWLYPLRGDTLKLSVTGCLTDRQTVGTLSPTLANAAFSVSEDGKKLFLAAKSSLHLLKKFAGITSIRVSSGADILANAKHESGKYIVTCFDTTQERVDEKHAYKDGSKWKTPDSDEAYASQVNASSVITIMRQMIAAHFGMSGGTSGSKKSAAETKAVIDNLQAALETAQAERDDLLKRLLALEAQASKKEATTIK